MKTAFMIGLAVGINAHNAMVKSALSHDQFKMVDHFSNEFTLHVWVTAERRAAYMLVNWAGMPSAVENLFRFPLPPDPTVFDDHEDFLEAVMATPHRAASIRRA